MMGNFVQGQEVLKQGATLYDPEKHHSLADIYGFDPKGASFQWIAENFWLLGYPEQALQTIEAGLAFTHGLAHPFSRCGALIFASYIHAHRGEWRWAQERAEAVINIATEHEFPHWAQYGQMERGYSLAHQGQAEEGIAEVLSGLAGQRASGTEAGRSRFLSLLAEAYEKAGQSEEGLSILAESLSFVDRTEERYYEAELYRLKGELELQSRVENHKSKVEEAEACFLKAIEVARRQKAKSWELRAVMSLAKLWQRQGKQREAHEMLAAVNNWFTEGFDTKDLQEAKALLESLGSSV